MADDGRTPNRSRETRSGAGGDGPSPASFAGAGAQFVVSILLFLYIGKWLDAKLETAPWLLMLGVFVGASAGFYSFYRRVTGAGRNKGDG